MNVSLSPELEKLVAAKVSSGRYTSASEVVREALRLFDERDRMREVRVQELRKELAVGVRELERGARAELDMGAIKAAARKRAKPERNRGAARRAR